MNDQRLEGICLSGVLDRFSDNQLISLHLLLRKEFVKRLKSIDTNILNTITLLLQNTIFNVLSFTPDDSYYVERGGIELKLSFSYDHQICLRLSMDRRKICCIYSTDMFEQINEYNNTIELKRYLIDNTALDISSIEKLIDSIMYLFDSDSEPHNKYRTSFKKQYNDICKQIS